MTFLLRNYQAVIGGLAVLILSALLWSARNERDSWHTKHDLVTAQFAKFRSDTAAEASAMQARYASNALRVQTEQDRISREASSDYQTRIAELNDRVASLRASSRANPGSRVGSLPSASLASSGTDGASQCDGLSLEDAFAADVNTARLIGWQNWWREQVAVQR